jgi:hypothetical protein
MRSSLSTSPVKERSRNSRACPPRMVMFGCYCRPRSIRPQEPGPVGMQKTSLCLGLMRASKNIIRSHWFHLKSLVIRWLR